MPLEHLRAIQGKSRATNLGWHRRSTLIKNYSKFTKMLRKVRTRARRRYSPPTA